MYRSVAAINVRLSIQMVARHDGRWNLSFVLVFRCHALILPNDPCAFRVRTTHTPIEQEGFVGASPRCTRSTTLTERAARASERWQWEQATSRVHESIRNENDTTCSPLPLHVGGSVFFLFAFSISQTISVWEMNNLIVCAFFFILFAPWCTEYNTNAHTYLCDSYFNRCCVISAVISSTICNRNANYLDLRAKQSDVI